jgi:hypothetical protein
MGYVPGSVAQIQAEVKHTPEVPVTSCNLRLPRPTVAVTDT